jgi:hypothetical protein
MSFYGKGQVGLSKQEEQKEKGEESWRGHARGMTSDS